MGDFVSPTPWQLAVVEHLLSVVPSNDTYLAQARRMRVRVEGDADQFEIQIPGAYAEGEKARWLALGEYSDADGFKVEIALHARGSVLELFERYKIGPDLIEREPPISEIAVWPHEPGTH